VLRCQREKENINLSWGGSGDEYELVKKIKKLLRNSFIKLLFNDENNGIKKDINVRCNKVGHRRRARCGGPLFSSRINLSRLPYSRVI